MRLVWIQKNKNPHRGESSIKESYVMSYVRKVILNKTPYSVLLPERLAITVYSFAPSAPDLTGVFRVLSVISPTATQHLRELLLRSIRMNHLLITSTNDYEITVNVTR